MSPDASNQGREPQGPHDAGTTRSAPSKVGWWVAGALIVAAAVMFVLVPYVKNLSPAKRPASLGVPTLSGAGKVATIDAATRDLFLLSDPKAAVIPGLEARLRAALLRAAVHDKNPPGQVTFRTPTELIIVLDAELERLPEQRVDIHRERIAVCYAARNLASAERSAAAILLERPDDLGAMLDMACMLRIRGEVAESERLCRRLGELAPDDGWRALSLGHLGFAAKKRGAPDEAEAHFKAALEIDERLGRDELIAVWCGSLGLLEHDRADLDAAESHYKRALEIDQRLGRDWYVAAHVNNLGSTAEDRKDYAEARRQWTLAIEMYRRLGAPQAVEKIQANIDELSDN